MKNVRDVVILALVGTLSNNAGVPIRDTIVSPFEGEIDTINDAITVANATGIDATHLIKKKEKLSSLIDAIKKNENMNEILDMTVDI